MGIMIVYVFYEVHYATGKRYNLQNRVTITKEIN